VCSVRAIRATNDYKYDYKKLDLLPLMYAYELQDLMFTIANLKALSGGFKFLDFIWHEDVA